MNLKNKDEKRYISMKYKLLIAYIMAIAVVIVGIVIVYSIGRDMTMRKNSYIMQTKQNNIKNTIEQELLNIYSFQGDFTVSSNINYYVDLYPLSSDYKRSQLVNDIFSDLELVMKNNEWIEEISVNIPSLGLCITNNEVRPYIESVDGVAIKQKSNSFINFPIVNNNFSISSNFPHNSKEMKYNIITQISKERIEFCLKQYFEKSENFLVVENGESSFLASCGMINEENYSDILSSINGKEKAEITDFSFNGTTYFMRYDSMFFNNLTILSMVAEQDLYAEINVYRNIFYITFIVVIMLIVIFILIFSHMINKPIQDLMGAFKQLETADLNAKISLPRKANDEFAVLNRSFEAMAERLKDSIYQNYYQQIIVQKMELKQLHTQVNPHFLHNSFFDIYSLAQMEDFEGVQNLSISLSKYYAYIMKHGEDVVSIKREYDFIMLYIDIQKIKYEKKLNVIVSKLPSSIENITIPKFVIQTLLENAYKYGANTTNGIGVIKVDFECTEGLIDITIEDDGTNLSDEKMMELNDMLSKKEAPSSSTGLYNVKSRIELYYNNRSKLELFRSNLGGLGVRLTIDPI